MRGQRTGRGQEDRGAQEDSEGTGGHPVDIEVLRAAVSRGPFLSGLSWENLPLPFWGWSLGPPLVVTGRLCLCSHWNFLGSSNLGVSKQDAPSL